MGYIRCGSGGEGGDNFLSVDYVKYIGNASLVNIDCHKNDIIIVLSYGSYAEAVSGCSVITTFQNYVKSQPRSVTILRAISDNISFKPESAWNYTDCMIITKNGENISCNVTSLVNSSSYTSGSATINTEIGDFLIFPHVPPTSSTTYSISNANIVSDAIISNTSSTYHIYAYKAYNTSSVVSVTYAQLESIIHLS